MSEQERKVLSGWLMLPVVLAGWAAVPLVFVRGEHALSIGLVLAAFLLGKGLFTLQPKEARVLVLFGRYVGTVRQEGFHWTNPFAVHRGPFATTPQHDGKEVTATVQLRHRYRVSLRTRTFETATLKVNDQRGNPIDIAAVVVWRVVDTARALFEVDDYEQYVHTQSETALRHLANRYPYDHAGETAGAEVTLRDDGDAVGNALTRELGERLRPAGVAVEQAKLTHLAYSPEIAHTMLRRQAAEAVIAARRKIVEGAVSMVEMALDELTRKQVLSLDDARRAAMVGNLLVVLCGESAAEPVVNTGSVA